MARRSGRSRARRGARPVTPRRAAGVAAVLALALLPMHGVAGAAAALAQPAASDIARAPLGPAERAAIARIERYFASVRTMRARFVQTASTGQTAEGTVALKRPGRLRIDYDPPVPVLIVADGTWLIYNDHDLNQVSYLPLGATPAGILVEDTIRLTGDELTITAFAHEAGVIRVTVVRTASPQDGSLTLVFSDDPLRLRQWRVVDPQGTATTVTLVDVTTGVDLDPDLFEFVDPRHVPPDFPE